MKKVISYFLFVLMIAAFVFELYFSITGAMDINHQMAELAAREAGGHEYLGIGMGVLVFGFGIVLTSIVGWVISIISRKNAQIRVIRILSSALGPSFLLPIFVFGGILLS